MTNEVTVANTATQAYHGIPVVSTARAFAGGAETAKLTGSIWEGVKFGAKMFYNDQIDGVKSIYNTTGCGLIYPAKYSEY